MITKIDPADIGMFSSLTFPHYARKVPQMPGVFVVAALHNGFVPAGLGVGQWFEDANRILSIYVAPRFRNKGVGGRLLDRLEDELRSQGPDRTYVSYETTGGDRAALEKLFLSRGYTPPQDYFFLYTVSCARMVREAKWMEKDFMRDGYTLVQLSEITEEEEEALKEEKERDGENLDWLTVDPTYYSDIHDAVSSLVLRGPGGIEGWMVTQRVRPDTVAYASLYIRPHLRLTGMALSLLGGALKRQHAAGILKSSCIIRMDNRKMLNTFNRRVRFAVITERRTVRQDRTVRHEK